GYLFSALIVIPHALSYPGAFAPKGLIFRGLHLGHFAVCAAGLSQLAGGRDVHEQAVQSRPTRSVFVS
ncbi:MAG: hypothetical protein WA196_19900, partial [Pseudolabrys sp.]